jgi:site-specific DNA-methyltransferase (adenine-specific)
MLKMFSQKENKKNWRSEKKMEIDLNKKLNLIQGDCLEILKQLPDKSIDLILTDPPYNIDFKPPRGTFDGILNDSMQWEEFDKFMQPTLNELYRILKEDSVAFIFTGFSSSSAFYKYATQSGFNIKCQIVWVKNNFGIGYHFRPQHEDIWACFKGNPKIPNKALSSVQFFDKVNGVDLVHSCEKPVPLLEKLLLQYTNSTDLIIDCFMGSGSTGVAALKNQRRFIGIELDKQYFDIAKRRCEEWENQERLF